MTRAFEVFPVKDFTKTKWQMLSWASRFGIFCFLDNHGYEEAFHREECLLALDPADSLEAEAGHAFHALRAFTTKHQDWLFGHFSYDLKNETESLQSLHPDPIGFPDLFFFVPRIVIALGKKEIRISSAGASPAGLLKAIESMELPDPGPPEPLRIEARISKSEYIRRVDALRAHILRGDCYEINFCQEFYSEGASLDPLGAFYRLSQISPMPFAGFYRNGDQYLICASPERYLAGRNGLLVAQPIKGTGARNSGNAAEDEKLRLALRESAKDRAENIMIVDLVRNDLSRVCEEGSVRVEELCGIYRFPQVHQMISTISGRLPADISWTEAIKASFPMGSMTGAPKKKAMELLEQYEESRRGLFSGALGYYSPDGDFDFNVVIRSMLYNRSSRYLSYQVGSAITYSSDAEKEYEECRLKASAILQVLGK